MSTRVHFVLILALAATAGVLLKMIYDLPSNQTELMLNEKSYLEVVNADAFLQLQEKEKSILKISGRYDALQKTKEDAAKVVAIVEDVRGQLVDIIAMNHDGDSVKNGLAHIVRSTTELSALTPIRLADDGAYQPGLNEPGMFGYSRDYLHLPLLVFEYTLVERASILLDSLASLYGETNIKFDLLTNIKNPNGEWIKGQIAFNPPGMMNLDHKERVQVRISKNFSKELSASMNRAETAVSDTLPVGDIMSVKLIGEDFEIVAYDDEEQGVTMDDFTQWEFDVTPKQSGNHPLYIKAGIVYYVPNLGPAKKYFPAYEKVVNVEVSAWQIVAGFVNNRWEFLLSSIVIPIGVWLFSRLRRKK